MGIKRKQGLQIQVRCQNSSEMQYNSVLFINVIIWITLGKHIGCFRNSIFDWQLSRNDRSAKSYCFVCQHWLLGNVYEKSIVPRESWIVPFIITCIRYSYFYYIECLPPFLVRLLSVYVFVRNSHYAFTRANTLFDKGIERVHLRELVHRPINILFLSLLIE